MKDETTDRTTRMPSIRFTPRSAVWIVGAAALIAATAAAGFVSSSAPTGDPTPAAGHRDSSRTALAAIVAHHPGINTPLSDLIKQGKLPKPSYRGDTGTIGVPKNVKQPAPADSMVRYVPGSVRGDFNLLQLGALALWVGCSPAQAPIAAAIAAAESGGNPAAQGDISLMDGTWDWSQGLWQIRGLRSERGTGGLRDSLANADPEKNAHAMYVISRGCTNWTPWTTYTSGAYLPYLGMSKTAVLAAKQFQNETGALPPFGTGSPVTVPSPSSSATHTAGRRGKHHHKASPSAHKSAQQGRHHNAPNRGPTSKAPVAATSKAPIPVRTSAAPAPHPVSSIVSKVTSAIRTKVPLPTKTTKLPVPKPISSVVGKITSAVPSIVP